MSERLTDEQLREWRDRYPEQPYAEQWSGKALIDELLALRARVTQLEAALEEIAERRFLAETMIEIARAALKDAPQ